MVTCNKFTAPKEDDVISTVMVPTDNGLNPAHHREIDLYQMDGQDIKLLQKNDPFMYYSIPGVLHASVRRKDDDYSDIVSLSRIDSHPPSPSQASKVSRRTCISFECHPDVLLAELEQEMGDRDLSLELKLNDIVSTLFGGSRHKPTKQ